MFKLLSFLIPLLLLSACKNVASENEKNQFQEKNGALFFDNKELVMWSHQALPNCQECDLTIYSKALPAGAMLFKQVNNALGELILLNVENARFSFALQAGAQQHSVRLQIVEESLSIALDQNDFFTLNKNVPMPLKVDNNDYYINLNALRFNSEQESSKASEKPAYEVDISIWLAQ